MYLFNKSTKNKICLYFQCFFSPETTFNLKSSDERLLVGAKIASYIAFLALVCSIFVMFIHYCSQHLHEVKFYCYFLSESPRSWAKVVELPKITVAACKKLWTRIFFNLLWVLYISSSSFIDVHGIYDLFSDNFIPLLLCLLQSAHPSSTSFCYF